MLIIPSILSDSKTEIQLQSEIVSTQTGISIGRVDIVVPEFVDYITLSTVDFIDVILHILEIEFDLITNVPMTDVVECS